MQGVQYIIIETTQKRKGMILTMQDYSEVFTFYRPLVPIARSQATLDYDLGNTLNINRNMASQLYELHYKKSKSILYEPDYLSSFIREFEVKSEEYDDYIVDFQKDSGYHKYLYAVDCPNFIYIWIETYKMYFDQTTLRELQKIIATKYHNTNKQIDEHIRRDKLRTTLINFSSDAFMKFYDYCRLQYLLQQITQFNFIPKFYNPAKGVLYFTAKIKVKREHIFERISLNKNLNIRFNPITIINNFGILSPSKNLKTNKWTQEMSIDSDLPNFIRFTLEYILFKNRNIQSLDDAVLFSYKKCLITEDFCDKTSDGATMNLPTKNNWQMISGEELRHTSKKIIDLNTIYDKYTSNLLNPVLQGSWA